jgi:hypothetical protein
VCSQDSPSLAYADDAEMLASQQMTLVELKMMFALADLDRVRDRIGLILVVLKCWSEAGL